MPLELFQTARVRESLKTPASVGIDLLMLLFIGCLAGSLFSFAREVSSPFKGVVEIDLSLWALPKYTMFSLARAFLAYGLSLIFTLIYGTVAAHNRRAEKFMVPALDVLQSIPVLSFMPVVVLAMIRLFPYRELGLELACVVMIFTGQVWNMTFSYYSSVRTLPDNLREAAELNSLSRWQVFKLLELPASMIGLVWNSMMSMAGGWFVLSLSEAFTLNAKSFQLPGLGSYMARAISDHNGWAEVSAVGAMFIMIIAVDQLFWRPIVAWSERFKIEDTADVNKPQSWVLSLINHSLFLQSVRRSLRNRRRVLAGGPATGQNGQNGQAATALGVPGGLARRLPLVQTPNPVTHGLSYVVVVLLAALSLWGAYSLFSLVRQVQGHDWGMIFLAFMLTFLRVLAAVFIGAAWTLPVGILIGRSAKWSQRLQPVVQIVSSFPAPMLFPLIYIVLVWLHIPFGIGCVVLMLMGTQWYTLFNVIAGAMAIPSELKEVARVYHTPRLKRWTRVYIPGVFPHLVTGLITAAGGAWNVTIVAEMLQMGHEDNPIITFGLGSMISQSSSNNFPLLAASTLTMACAVVLINRFMWKRLYRLAERRYSLNV